MEFSNKQFMGLTLNAQHIPRNVMIDKVKQFYEDVIRELKKVSWPEREQVINSTFVVFVISVLFTAFIYIADLVVSSLFNLFYLN